MKKMIYIKPEVWMEIMEVGNLLTSHSLDGNIYGPVGVKFVDDYLDSDESLNQ